MLRFIFVMPESFQSITRVIALVQCKGLKWVKMGLYHPHCGEVDRVRLALKQTKNSERLPGYRMKLTAEKPL